MKTKFMTLMTVATLGIFSAATVMAAGNNDFYTQPPAGSEWEKSRPRTKRRQHGCDHHVLRRAARSDPAGSHLHRIGTAAGQGRRTCESSGCHRRSKR